VLLILKFISLTIHIKKGNNKAHNGHEMWIVWLSNKLLRPTISQWGHDYENITQIKKKLNAALFHKRIVKKFSCTPRLLQRSSTAPHLRSLSHTNVCTRLR